VFALFIKTTGTSVTSNEKEMFPKNISSKIDVTNVGTRKKERSFNKQSTNGSTIQDIALLHHLKFRASFSDFFST